MKNGPIEWKLLYRSLALLLLALLVGSGIMYGGWDYHMDAENALAKLRSQITALQGQKQQQAQLDQQLNQALPMHETLRQRGVVGTGARLQWVEILKEAEQQLKLPGPIRYKLEAARPVTTPFPLPAMPELQLQASRMELNLGLLHEGDLVALIDFLANKKTGLYHFVMCRLQPTGDPTQESGKLSFEVHIQGLCHLEWFNFREQETQKK
ncbi:MAG: hypothetical protein G8237_06240 [Magnetococcales bacterium]|nr:hypothetical protein [Magnetococcales bacterium]